MAHLNKHFLKLQNSYLFPQIQKKAALFKEKNPDVELLNLGIGDISRPLCPSIVEALKKATLEMGEESTFRGYGPAEGYLFLREAIKKTDYATLPISTEEIFISDGTKNDIAHIQELFSLKNIVALPDPTYPVYLDSEVMAGRSGPKKKDGSYKKFVYLPCVEENNFFPKTPISPVDLIYLCSPNNPTGTALTKEELTKWVQYARETNALIFFDGAYEAFITEKDIPHSIYEIPGADEVAIEFRSFSKTAGFTGLRCSYVIFPKKLKADGHFLYPLWKRKIETTYGGTSYPIQRAAEAIYSPSGKKETKELITEYLQNSKLLKEGLQTAGFTVYGGTNAPYLWCKTPNKTSWEVFDDFLHNLHIVSVPGAGFGPSGEGFVRFSCFGKKELIEKAVSKLHKKT